MQRKAGAATGGDGWGHPSWYGQGWAGDRDWWARLGQGSYGAHRLSDGHRGWGGQHRGWEDEHRGWRGEHHGWRGNGWVTAPYVVPPPFYGYGYGYPGYGAYPLQPNIYL